MNGIKKIVRIICLIALMSISPDIGNAGGFKLTPSVGVKGEYNDNLFFDDVNEIDDYITTLFGGLALMNRTERLDLNLSARLDGVMYADNDDLDDVDQFYTGRIGYRISERVRLGADAGYSVDSRSDRDIETTGIVLGTVKRKRWTGGVSGDVTLSEKSAASLAFNAEDDKFDDPGSVDYTFYGANLGFTHDFSEVLPRVIGRINAGYNYYNTDDTDIENMYATVGFSRSITELFNLLIDAGIRYAASEFKVATVIPTPPFLITTTTDTEYDSGFNGRIVLAYAGETTRADISASQRLEPASGRNGTADRTSFVFNIRKRFAEKFSASLYATYYLNKADAGKLARQDIDEETVSIRPGLSYQIIDNLVLTASYTFTRVEYKIQGTEPKRNRVYLRLSYGIPLFE
jgi:Putative beta-barrel porin 2